MKMESRFELANFDVENDFCLCLEVSHAHVIQLLDTAEVILPRFPAESKSPRERTLVMVLIWADWHLVFIMPL